MIVYPAIDLKDGRCVRLVRGEMKSATVFNDDPAAQAHAFTAAGAAWIHVVDLDGAFAGKPRNAAAVEAIVKAAPVKVQLGGGIRDEHTIESWLEKGIARAILGTAVLGPPTFIRNVCDRWPGRIVLGIDGRGGKVAVEGWSKTADISPIDLAQRFADVGAAAIIYTDIDRDGARKGVNVDATYELSRAVPIPVIASGGIASLDDIAALKAAGIAGAIIGRALYDKSVDLESALALAAT